MSVALQIKFAERWNVEKESVGLRQLTKIHLTYSVNVSLDGSISKWTLTIQTSFLHYHVSFPNVNFTQLFLPLASIINLQSLFYFAHSMKILIKIIICNLQAPLMTIANKLHL